MNENRCVACGAVIPEGRQVCPICETKSREQIEEMAKDLDSCPYIAEPIGCNKHDGSVRIAEYLYNAGYRKQDGFDWYMEAELYAQRIMELEAELSKAKREVIDEFATKLKNYPISVRLPLLGLETKEEIETYVNNLFDQIEDIVDKIAKEMKGGE